MCKKFGWVIATASFSAMVQSVIWMGLGIVGALVYTCVIPVEPYKNPNDFFRVTFVKLYFEGRKSTLDGSYLGQFNKDYENVINLFTRDIVFTVMISYVILNAVYFFLSVAFYKSRNGGQNTQKIALSWSVMNLVLCALDFVFTYGMILDILSFKKYQSDNPSVKGLDDVIYIPLTLSLLSSRFIAGWIWNFCFGFMILFDVFCCSKITGKPAEEVQEKTKEVEETPEKPEEKEDLKQGYINPYLAYRLDRVETSTRFGPPQTKPNPGWVYPSTGAFWHGRDFDNGEWEKTNEGYVSDEGTNRTDFDHDLKNFESGQRKIKVVKPPIGKPVNIPVPPPLPPSGSCNC